MNSPSAGWNELPSNVTRTTTSKKLQLPFHLLIVNSGGGDFTAFVSFSVQRLFVDKRWVSDRCLAVHKSKFWFLVPWTLCVDISLTGLIQNQHVFVKNFDVDRRISIAKLIWNGGRHGGVSYAQLWCCRFTVPRKSSNRGTVSWNTFQKAPQCVELPRPVVRPNEEISKTNVSS